MFFSHIHCMILDGELSYSTENGFGIALAARVFSHAVYEAPSVH
jgi:hypothetical protein